MLYSPDYHCHLRAVKILNHAVSEVCDDDKHNITDNYNEPIEDIDKIPPGWLLQI